MLVRRSRHARCWSNGVGRLGPKRHRGVGWHVSLRRSTQVDVRRCAGSGSDCDRRGGAVRGCFGFIAARPRKPWRQFRLLRLVDQRSRSGRRCRVDGQRVPACVSLDSIGGDAGPRDPRRRLQLCPSDQWAGAGRRLQQHRRELGVGRVSVDSEGWHAGPRPAVGTDRGSQPGAGGQRFGAGRGGGNDTRRKHGRV